ncbi:MAG: hypothetical protein AAFO59_12905, partial [Cyanobacteria bacterium J06607_17]
ILFDRVMERIVIKLDICSVSACLKGNFVMAANIFSRISREYHRNMPPGLALMTTVENCRD